MTESSDATSTHPSEMGYGFTPVFQYAHAMIDIAVLHPWYDYAKIRIERNLVDSKEWQNVRMS